MVPGPSWGGDAACSGLSVSGTVNVEGLGQIDLV